MGCGGWSEGRTSPCRLTCLRGGARERVGRSPFVQSTCVDLRREEVNRASAQANDPLFWTRAAV
jgi:hypothetical protein